MTVRKILITSLLVIGCSGGQTKPDEKTNDTDVTVVADQNVCEMPEADQAFVGEFLHHWNWAQKEVLKWEGDQLPTIVFANKTCTFYLAAKTTIEGTTRIDVDLTPYDRAVAVHSMEHSGEIALPDGSTFKLMPAAFAKKLENSEPFFYLGSMDLWREHPKASQITNAAEFVISIALHEFTHTQQLASLTAALKQIVPEDDSNRAFSEVQIEKAFSENAEYQAAIQAEVDQLWKAVVEKDLKKRADLIRDAKAKRDARHKKYFVGEFSLFAKTEGMFWNMEGIAEWTRTQLLLSHSRLEPNERLAAAEPTFKNYMHIKATEPGLMVQEIRQHTKRERAQEAGLALVLLAENYPGFDAKLRPPADLYTFLIENLDARK